MNRFFNIILCSLYQTFVLGSIILILVKWAGLLDNYSWFQVYLPLELLIVTRHIGIYRVL